MIYDKVNNLKDNISMKRERLFSDRTLKKLMVKKKSVLRRIDKIKHNMQGVSEINEVTSISILNVMAQCRFF